MASLKGGKFLLIGGAGFIGSHIAEELVKKDAAEIIIYDNFSTGSMENLAVALKDPRVKIFPAGGDVRDVDVLDDAVKNTDIVFHLAALRSIYSDAYPRSCFDVNFAGTFNVLEACARNKIKKVVYSSSASVYGNALQRPMTEEHPFNNQQFYGASKITGEQLCRSFHTKYGLDYVALRYFNVYGARQDYKGVFTGVLMRVLDQIKQGKALVVDADGACSYDYIYVTDIAQANIAAAEAEVTHDYFNICTGTSVTIEEVVGLMLELTGSKLKPRFEPRGKTPVSYRLGSPDKAKKVLGFEAKVGLKEGLKKMIEWSQRTTRPFVRG